MKKIAFLFLVFQLSVTAQIKKVDSLLQLGNYLTALKVLDTKTSSFEVENKKGLIYQQIGNYRLAILNYNKALVLKNDFRTKENLGKCYQKTNQISKAFTLFEDVLKERPNNTLLKYHLAKLYKSKLQFNKAKKLFKSIILTDATNSNYYYYLGSTYLHLKQKDSAKIQFFKAVTLDSTHFKSLYNLAKQTRKKDKYKKFRKRLKGKFKAVNNDTSYYYLKKGLKYYPKSTALNQLAAKYYFYDNDYLKAINHFLALPKLDSERKLNLAICYYQLKDYEKAMDYLYDLIDTKKANGKTFFYLSLIYKDKKNYELAQKYMEFAIDVEQPQLTEYYFQLGMIFQEDKQLEKAITNFKLALEDDLYNNKAQYQLALTCDSFYKDKTIAMKHYKNYLRRFSYRDKQTTAFVKQRIVELEQLMKN